MLGIYCVPGAEDTALNKTEVPVIPGDLSLQRLEAGFRFPSQRLKSSHGSENAES